MKLLFFLILIDVKDRSFVREQGNLSLAHGVKLI